MKTQKWGALHVGGVGGLAAAGLGLSVSVALAVFVLAREVADASPVLARTPMTFVVAAVAFLPILVAHTLRARVRTQAADFLVSSWLGKQSPMSFAIGWVAAGGYVVTGALLTKAVAGRVDVLAEKLGGIPLDDHYWVLGTVILLALQELAGDREWWGARTTLVYLILLTVVGLVGYEAVMFNPWTGPLPNGSAASGSMAFDRWATVIAIVGAAAWSTDVVLAHARELRRPERSATVAVLVSWVVAMVLGGVVGLLLALRPELRLRSLEEAISWRGNPMGMAATVLGVLLCWMGLTRSVRAGNRLIFGMRRDGFFEPIVSREETGRPTRAFLLGTVAVVVLVLLAPSLVLIELSTAAFLLASVLTFLPPTVLEASGKKLTPIGGRAGLTRAWSAVGLAVAVVFLVVLPLGVVATVAAWAVVGVVGRIALHARAAPVTEEASEEEEGEGESAGEEEEERRAVVLAAHVEGADLESLARAAAGMVGEAGEEALLLGLVALDEEVPYDRLHGRARRLRAQLRRRVRAIPEAGERVRVIVRISPSVPQGILDAAEELEVDRILVGWPTGQHEVAEPEIEEVFDRTERALGILFGRLRAVPQRVVVAAGGGSNARQALPFARGLASGHRAPVEMLRVALGSAEMPAEQDVLDSVLGADVDAEGVVPVVRHGAQLWPTIRDASAGAPLVLGASQDPLLERAVFGGTPFEIAVSRTHPTLVVKAAEKLSTFWLRRMWDLVTHPFPPISETDRVEVLGAMRRQAKGDVDFFVLMVISSLIAILGLVQDSSATVIGAMLVAPLMSPIVAVAHGIVLGSLPLMRRGMASIAKGAMTAVAVATLMTLLLPIQEAPREVIARVQPNLLDLVVALAAGAAAAYGAARRSIAGALPGVAIAVALVPPLCVVGFGLGTGELAIAGGALLLFATNLAGIVLVGALIFVLLGFRPTRAVRADLVKWGIVAAVAAMLLLTIPLSFTTRSTFEERVLHWRVMSAAEAVEAVAPIELREVDVDVHGDQVRLTPVVFAFEPLDEAAEGRIIESLERAARRPVEVRLVVLNAHVVGR